MYGFGYDLLSKDKWVWIKYKKGKFLSSIQPWTAHLMFLFLLKQCGNRATLQRWPSLFEMLICTRFSLWVT